MKNSEKTWKEKVEDEDVDEGVKCLLLLNTKMLNSVRHKM